MNCDFDLQIMLLFFDCLIDKIIKGDILAMLMLHSTVSMLTCSMFYHYY